MWKKDIACYRCHHTGKGCYFNIVPLWRSGPVNWKKTETKLNQTGSLVHQGLFIGLVFCSPVASQNITKPMKTSLNQFQLVHMSCELYPTLSRIIPSNSPWIIKNGWELREMWPNTFWCKYFVMIWVVVIVLLIPCATKILDTIGHYS